MQGGKLKLSYKKSRRVKFMKSRKKKILKEQVYIFKRNVKQEQVYIFKTNFKLENFNCKKGEKREQSNRSKEERQKSR